MDFSMTEPPSANLVLTNVPNVLELLIFVLSVLTLKIEFKTLLAPV